MKQDRNNLYPIFLKVEQLEVLIVGGGFVAEEKLSFLLKSSPNAKVTMVAPFFTVSKEAKCHSCSRLISFFLKRTTRKERIVGEFFRGMCRLM